VLRMRPVVFRLTALSSVTLLMLLGCPGPDTGVEPDPAPVANPEPDASPDASPDVVDDGGQPEPAAEPDAQPEPSAEPDAQPDAQPDAEPEDGGVPDCVDDERTCNEEGGVDICIDGQWRTLAGCPTGTSCVEGECIDDACEPQCDDRVCGDDGCDGECGTCDDGDVCNAAGQCVSESPDCGNGTCGDDEDCSTCPADCGTCCGNGTCAAEQGENCATCPADCACADDETCNPNARMCEDICVPDCDGTHCGSDGCGDVCACGDGDACNVDTELCEEICVPQCDVNDACGDDGCGGVCGTCADGDTCGADRQCHSAGGCAACTNDEVCIDGVCRLQEQECSAQNPTGLCPGGFDCIAGECIDNGAACSAQNPTGSCAPGEVCMTGSCVVVDGAALCDDDNACTDDIFDFARNRCVHQNNAGSCSDGNSCTTDTCSAGMCVSSPVGGCVEPPSIEPVASPTNVNQVVLVGEKPAGAAIVINGQVAVADNPDTTWSVDVSLAQGENVFTVQSQDMGTLSGSVEVRVVYDITEPTLHMSPAGGIFLNGVTMTVASSEPATVHYTTDGSTPTTYSPKFRSIREFRVFDDTSLAFLAVDDAGNVSNVVEAAFEITSHGNGWADEGDLDEPLLLFGALEAGGQLTIAGGTDGNAPQAGVYSIDPQTGARTTLPSMNMARSQLALVEFGGWVYALGGENSGIPLNMSERFNLSSSTEWEQRAPLPTTRYGAAGVVVGSYLYLMGGRANTPDALTTVERTTDGTTWTNDVLAMPRGRIGAHAIAHEGRIYVVGGEDSDGNPVAEVDIFNPGSNTWTTGASMPTPRAHTATALQRNIGGIDTGFSGIVVAGGRLAGGAATAIVEEYIIDDDAWRQRTPLDVPRHSAAAVGTAMLGGIDGQTHAVWMLGGQEASGPSTRVTRYSHSHDYVRHLAPMPEGRFMHAAAVAQNRIYIFGGRNFQETLEGWAFDPETETFTPMAPLPVAQNDLAVAVVEDRIYAIGGANTFGLAVPWVHTYDPVADAWTELTPMPTARRAPAVVVKGDDIYVVGGDNNGALQTVEIYNTQTDSWTTGPLALPRKGAQAALHDGDVHVFGGEDLNGLATSNQRLTTTWTTFGSTQRSNADAIAVHDRLVFFGGRTADGVTGTEHLYRFNEGYGVTLSSSLMASLEHQAAVMHNGSIYIFGGINEATLQPPGATLVQKVDSHCFNGVQDARETSVDEGGGCLGQPTLGNGIRLIGGTFSGRLEIFYNGTWGTVCDDSFGSVDADVACTQYLGAPASGTAYTHGGGSGTIWLDDVGCTGNEMSLAACSHRGWGSHNCSHGEDVGVTCSYR